ncbi:lipase family protein [Providencia stuartii]|uniref:lipase family protein n=1 Tax=Providencia stuartii TaxID=588 RepID=UPI0024B0B7FB
MTDPYINNPDCPDCNKHKAWIECILVDEFNQPLANMAYTLKVRGGIVRQNKTDANGYFREENLPRTLVTLTLSSKELMNEMENRPLRTLRGQSHSTVKPDAQSQGYFYRYAVVGELCDKTPTIPAWDTEKFGLPYYHFPKEDEFKGLEFYGQDFNQRHVIEVCPFRAWSLILKHTPEYNMVNAYNLGLMSLLVYFDETMVDPDSQDMREFLNVPDTTTSFFYQQCFDLSKTPVINDDRVYSAIVTDVPFKERYRPAIFLDASQSANHEKGDHDTKMFYVENETQIIAAWRGTASLRSVLTDATYQPIPCPTTLLSNGTSKVHRGFLEAYQCVEKYFHNKIGDLKSTVGTKDLFITGHSLGGALALLHSTELKKNNPLLYTYGMPRVFTISAAKELASLHHYRHVNDADTVTSVPFDTNMDSWLFNVGGWLGTTLGALWTVGTLPSVPLQKALADFGEVYCHHGKPVSFFKSRQIGEERIPSKSGRDNDYVGKKRWRMNGTHKFYLVPTISNTLDEHLKREQIGLVQSLEQDKNILDDIFPQFNNPNLDTLVTVPTDHLMAFKYQAIINNQLLSILEPSRTPKLVTSRETFEKLIRHDDAYPLNAKRNNTFIKLENMLQETVKQVINQDTLLQLALERYKEDTHEISL